jgi:hypothetical protein
MHRHRSKRVCEVAMRLWSPAQRHADHDKPRTAKNAIETFNR